MRVVRLARIAVSCACVIVPAVTAASSFVFAGASSAVTRPATVLPLTVPTTSASVLPL